MKQKYILKSGSLDKPIRVKVKHPGVAARRFFARALEGVGCDTRQPTYLGTRYEQVPRAKGRGTVRVQVVMYGHPSLPRCLEVWEDKQ